ncbi:MAG: NAD(P)/FAD-dependent oxidoreductase [Desulfobacteraceae bacterium]|nr:NAD(P)/FAD-dependent oxidoreductase [Desulfobacteraceae bacterium]
MKENDYDALIAGTGPAGLTAALYGQRMGLRTVVFGDLPGGSTYMIENLANFPGLMPETSGTQFGTMTFQQVSQEGAHFTMSLVESLQVTNGDGGRRRFMVRDAAGKEYTAPAAIIATGRTPKQLAVGNAQMRGVHFCSICDGPLYRGKEAVLAVVGGGNPAAQHALTLARIAREVFLVCRSANPGMDDAHKRQLAGQPNVTLMTGTEVVGLQGKDLLEALVVKTVDGGTKDIPVEGMFQAIGWNPNTGFLDMAVDATAEGYLKTDASLMTSCPGLFAAGDVRETDMWQVLTSCADGARAAKHVVDYLADS